MKHQHKFVAIPITGRNVSMTGEHEALFGWRVECEQCHKKPKLGDHVVELKQSWLKEIVPAIKIVDIVYAE